MWEPQQSNLGRTVPAEGPVHPSSDTAPPRFPSFVHELLRVERSDTGVLRVELLDGTVLHASPAI